MNNSNFKILNSNINLLEIKKYFEKKKIDKYISNEFIKISSEAVPFSITLRKINTTTIYHDKNKIKIKGKKKDRIIAFIILITEYLAQEGDITFIYVNNNLVTQETTINDFLNWTKTKYYSIVIYYNDEESAQNATFSIYYLITPYRHNNYYFNKEYDRIKNKKTLWKIVKSKFFNFLNNNL